MRNPNQQVKIFYSYSHDDEALRKKLDDHLAFLQRESVIMWYDREIVPGHVLDESIQKELNEADIILLLVSSSFLSSFYCYDIEMKRAMERHESKEAVVVPVLLSDCVWQKAPFAKLLMTPYDAKPIDNPKHWATVNEAFTNVAKGLEKTVNWVKQNKLTQKDIERTTTVLPTVSENKLSDAPKPRPYFTGRDKEIEGFKKAIDDKSNFIAIDGAGGIGKTQFVSRCIEKYIASDKIIWYECTTASQLDTLISEAGYPELLKGSGKTDREKFSAFKDKIQENEFYLFLDNFQETNNNPVFKEFLKFIQEYLKKGCVVVIDRDNITDVNLKPNRIHIEGFTEKKLEYAKALIAFSYKGSVTITDSELEKLCEQLQGYPLAIDFAILLLSEGETPSNIITKIAMDGEAGQISERLLNAIFSRPDATKEERDFMRQFSVFTGSVFEQAVIAVISDSITKAAPKKLQRKNLLTYFKGIYEIHPLVREFCYKDLNEQERESVHSKVAEYLITQRTETLSPTSEEQIFYHLSQSKQWKRIEEQIEENGRQFILLGQLGLVKELLDKLKNIGIEKPIFNILYGDIAEIQGDWDEAQRCYDNACIQEEDKKVKAEGIIKYGEMLHRKGKVKEALPYYEEAYRFSNEKHYLKEEARALNDIGLVYGWVGNIESAYEKYAEGLKIRINIGDKEGVATSLSNIGSTYYTKGDLNKALSYHQESLKIHEEIGNKQGIGNTFNHIGNIYDTIGDFEKALDHFKQSLEIQEKIGSKQGIASSLSYIGGMHYTRGDLDKALAFEEQSLKIKEEISNQAGIAASFSSFGRIYRTKGNLDIALDYQQKCWKIQQEMDSKQGMATTLANIGSVYKVMGDLDKALNYFEQGLKINEETGSKIGIAACLGSIGDIYKDKGDLDKALKYYLQSLNIQEEVGNKQGIAGTINGIGRVYDYKGDWSKALKYYTQSLAIEEGIGHKSGIANSYADLGSVYLHKNDLDKALEYYELALKIQTEIGNKDGIAATLNGISGIYVEKKDFNRALSYLEQSLQITTEIGNKQGLAACLGNIGVIYASNGFRRYDSALVYLFKSLSLSNSIGTNNVSIEITQCIMQIRDKELELRMFKTFAQQAYDSITPELQKYIALNEFLKEPVHKEYKTGRNDPCPCGSGKKYKKCHGQELID